METLDLNNKQNGQKLQATEWNTLVNTINQMIEVLNQSGTAITKLSQLTNDAGFITLNDVPEGRSAYQIAIDNGFNGTVEEWIESLKGADGTMSFEDLTEEQRESLVGETGPAGPSAYQSYLNTTTDNPKLSEADWIASLHGQDGAVGPQGPTGQSGITPYIDPVTKHWMIGESDTNVLAEGQAGITPHIESGYWFIGSINTEIKAQGSDGKSTYEVYCETVPEGQTPMTQSEWLNSLKGPTGPDGIPGEKGEKGDKGDKGDKGEKGDTGEGFQIYKTYLTIQEMDNDAANVQEGKFVMIASSVEDEDNSKLYVKNTQGGFTYINDLSGAQGIKGENGITPHIGDNGHWFIGDTDTNVIAQGQNGISPELPQFKTINGKEITGEGDITINGGSEQVQANWNESDNTQPSYIQNKPTIPEWALQENKPVYTAAELGVITYRSANWESEYTCEYNHDTIPNSNMIATIVVDDIIGEELIWTGKSPIFYILINRSGFRFPIKIEYVGKDNSTQYCKISGSITMESKSAWKIENPILNSGIYNEYFVKISNSLLIRDYKKLNVDYSYDEPTSTLNINQ